MVQRKEYKKRVIFPNEEQLRAERKAKIEDIFDKNDLI